MAKINSLLELVEKWNFVLRKAIGYATSSKAKSEVC